MAIDGNLPQYLENVGKKNHARSDRRLLEATFQAAGVLGPGDLAVTPSSPGAMSVDVAAGSVLVKATTGNDQGLYFIRNSAALLDVLIDPSDPTDDRRDLVVMHVLDSEHDGGVLDNGPDNPPVAVIAGTPAGSPVDPTVPDNCEVLARVRVAAGDTTVSVVDDLRRRAPHETQQTDAIAWTANTSSFDMDSWAVPATPLHYDVIITPEVSIAWQPQDAVAWNVTFGIFTAAAGAGTLLGKVGRRSPGNNVEAATMVPGNDLLVPAGTQATLFLHAAYGGVPTSGFSSTTVGERTARTRIRPARA